ncbi:MAG: hypothetical protein R3F59_11825 [Myxococcota bacterium]
MYGRILHLHGQDPEIALRVLFSGDFVGPEPVNHAAMRWTDYFEAVYQPWRTAKRPRTWVTEVGRWRRILPVLGKKRLRDVDAHLVADYIDEAAGRAGRDRAAGERGDEALHRDAVQALLNDAHRQRHHPRARRHVGVPY